MNHRFKSALITYKSASTTYKSPLNHHWIPPKPPINPIQPPFNHHKNPIHQKGGCFFFHAKFHHGNLRPENLAWRRRLQVPQQLREDEDRVLFREDQQLVGLDVRWERGTRRRHARVVSHHGENVGKICWGIYVRTWVEPGKSHGKKAMGKYGEDIKNYII